jgi:hypothetical protein
MSSHQRDGRSLGLNAVGKPYGANYDPHYKLRGVYGKPAGLYAPYGPSMRFVGDPPKVDKEHWRRRKLPPPAPLLDGQLESNDGALNIAAVNRLLHSIEKQLRGLRRAIVDNAEKTGRGSRLLPARGETTS